MQKREIRKSEFVAKTQFPVVWKHYLFRR